MLSSKRTLNFHFISEPGGIYIQNICSPIFPLYSYAIYYSLYICVTKHLIQQKRAQARDQEKCFSNRFVKGVDSLRLLGIFLVGSHHCVVEIPRDLIFNL